MINLHTWEHSPFGITLELVGPLHLRVGPFVHHWAHHMSTPSFAAPFSGQGQGCTPFVMFFIQFATMLTLLKPPPSLIQKIYRLGFCNQKPWDYFFTKTLLSSLGEVQPAVLQRSPPLLCGCWWRWSVQPGPQPWPGGHAGPFNCGSGIQRGGVFHPVPCCLTKL